jgi:hypothetical protein
MPQSQKQSWPTKVGFWDRVEIYGELLTPGQWVEVGSVCKQSHAERMTYFSEMPRYATHSGLCGQEEYVSALLSQGT